MCTIEDLIRKGIIKEYIPPKAVTKLKEKKPVPLQIQFPEVFKAWCDSDISNKKKPPTFRQERQRRKKKLCNFREGCQQDKNGVNAYKNVALFLSQYNRIIPSNVYLLRPYLPVDGV